MPMKSCLVLIVALFAASIVFAEEPHPGPVKMPKDFAKVKELVGKWETTSKGEKGEEKGEVTYELTSGGSAVMEKLFPGTPHEMVSMYHAEKNKVAMTHYCALGNQPNMKLKKANDKTLVFEMAGVDGIGSKKDMHMHGLTLTWKDKDHVTQEWTLFKNGKKVDTKVIELARK
jgi:hypothetical protein